MEYKLSAIIPCFNHGQYLPEALASLDNSPKRDQIEVIIINDGSTDEFTNDYIAGLDTNKYVIINQENLGLAKARNNGILTAQADFVLMLDADNYVEEVFLTDFFNLIQTNQSFDALYGDARFFGEVNKVQVQGEIDLLKLLKDNHIDACAIFNKITLINLGLYDDMMPVMGWEDWDLWLKLSFNDAKIIYKSKVYFNYRFLNNSMIRTHNLERFNGTKIYLTSKHLHKNENIMKIIKAYNFNYLSYKNLNSLYMLKFKKTFCNFCKSLI
ncbi:MAG TPA: glycosyltransferase family A protein [Bacteroidales bacterium]|nr:glycosyltransferase family A protein [Bacteroidales bacterium]